MNQIDSSKMRIHVGMSYRPESADICGFNLIDHAPLRRISAQYQRGFPSSGDDGVEAVFRGLGFGQRRDLYREWECDLRDQDFGYGHAGTTYREASGEYHLVRTTASGES